MLTNASLTIFNRFPDGQSRKFVYIPYYIPNVWFHTDQKVSVGDGGLKSADIYRIRVPYSECGDWLPSNDFADLTDPEGKWTVQNGDFFIVGEWTGNKVSGIEEIKKEFSGVVGRINSHSENFFGSSKHIRIGGGA